MGAVTKIETAGVTFGGDTGTGTGLAIHAKSQSQGGIGATAAQLSDVGKEVFKATDGLIQGLGMKEFLLRIEVARDVWQVITLFFTSITFPFGFTSIFGKISAIFAVDLSFVYDVDIVITFYLGVAGVFTAFIILIVVSFIEKRKSQDEVQEFHTKVRGDRDEAHRAGIVYEPPDKTTREMICLLFHFLRCPHFICPSPETASKSYGATGSFNALWIAR